MKKTDVVPALTDFAVYCSLLMSLHTYKPLLFFIQSIDSILLYGFDDVISLFKHLEWFLIAYGIQSLLWSVLP